MNNKFRELAQKATEWCEENAQGTPVAWEWEEKFAELIVSECIQVIQGDVVRNGPTPENERTYLHISTLQSHFGIEQ